MRDESAWLTGRFERATEPVVFPGRCELTGQILTAENAWRSQGSPSSTLQDRALSRTLDIKISDSPVGLSRIVIYGVFGMSEEPSRSSNGQFGLTMHLRCGADSVYQMDCLKGHHLFDSRELEIDKRAIGDGTELESVGSVLYRETEHRIDRLTFAVLHPILATSIQVQVHRGSFGCMIFHCLAESVPMQGCPFHSQQGGISLSDIPSIIRVGEVTRWQMAIVQLSEALLRAYDLDEARSQALTFIAVLTAAALEKGADRSMHRVQLDTARLLDQQTTVEEVLRIAMNVIEHIAKPLFGEVKSPSAHLVQKSLAYVERNFARKLDDEIIADHFGLSTSHFRFLFREATGQPFHRYLISMRLEQARRLLVEGSTQVSEVANAVGFRSTSHFSRAFSQRFGMSPVEVRKQIGKTA